MSGSLATNLDSNGNGLTALDYRRILQGFYPNPGIVKGGTVTGNSSLTYHVAPTVAVIDRGSDGTRLAYYAGGDTPAVAAGDASNRRIDVIWLKANDPALDGGSNEVVIGVTQGTPSANPAPPTLESGQLALMEKLVQPGTTNLSTGSGDNRLYNYAIPYGGNLGRLGFASNSSQDELPIDSKWHQQLALTTIVIPTDRLVEIWWTARAVTKNTVAADYGVRVLIDGTVVDDGVFDQVPVVNHTTTQSIRWTTVLTGGMAHTITFETIGDYGVPIVWSGNRSGEARDIGVAR